MGRPAEGYLNPWFPLLLLLLLKQVLEITAPTQTHIHTHTHSYKGIFTPGSALGFIDFAS